jgi:hypothetical protein
VVLRANVPFRRAAGLAFASDTLSITTMEIVDNGFILIVHSGLKRHQSSVAYPVSDHTLPSRTPGSKQNGSSLKH